MSGFDRLLRRLLESCEDERAIHAFLKKNPILVRNSFARSWNSIVAVSEPSLGGEFRPDFLVLSASSCNWDASFIELESPKARLYLKDGTPSRQLRAAMKQITDWRGWIHLNEPMLRSALSRILEERNEHARCSRPDIHRYAHTEVLDPRVVVGFDYHIVIGRRDSLTPEEQRRRAMDTSWGGPAIATYDRLLDMARKIDSADTLQEIAAKPPKE